MSARAIGLFGAAGALAACAAIIDLESPTTRAGAADGGIAESGAPDDATSLGDGSVPATHRDAGTPFDPAFDPLLGDAGLFPVGLAVAMSTSDAGIVYVENVVANGAGDTVALHRIIADGDEPGVDTGALLGHTSSCVGGTEVATAIVGSGNQISVAGSCSDSSNGRAAWAGAYTDNDAQTPIASSYYMAPTGDPGEEKVTGIVFDPSSQQLAIVGTDSFQNAAFAQGKARANLVTPGFGTSLTPDPDRVGRVIATAIGGGEVSVYALSVTAATFLADSTWGNSGFLGYTPSSGNVTNAQTTIVDGHPVIAGVTDAQGAFVIAYETDGKGSFATDVISFTSPVTLGGVAAGRDTVTFAGCIGTPSAPWLARYTIAAGNISPDQTFGRGGSVLIPSLANHCIQSVAIDSANRTVVLIAPSPITSLEQRFVARTAK